MGGGQSVVGRQRRSAAGRQTGSSRSNQTSLGGGHSNNVGFKDGKNKITSGGTWICEGFSCQMGGLPKKGKLYGRKLNNGQERNWKGNAEHNTGQ